MAQINSWRTLCANWIRIGFLVKHRLDFVFSWYHPPSREIRRVFYMFHVEYATVVELVDTTGLSPVAMRKGSSPFRRTKE